MSFQIKIDQSTRDSSKNNTVIPTVHCNKILASIFYAPIILGQACLKNNKPWNNAEFVLGAPSCRQLYV